MQQTEMLWPVVAMAGLTFTVLGLVPIRRFGSVGRGEVGAEDFALGESARVPPRVALANRNYMNLLEAPLLFYVGAVCFFVTSMVDGWALSLAWGYVALRAIHSLVHVTYNNVRQRLVLFALSNFVLIALWIIFGIRLWGHYG